LDHDTYAMNALPALELVSAVTPAQRLRVVRLAGALYGLLFAAGFAVAFWGPYTWTLLRAHAAEPHAALGIGLAVCLPVGLAAGALTILTERARVRAAVWLIATALMMGLAAHVVFEGVSWYAMLNDPYPTERVMYPFPATFVAPAVLAMLVAAFFGFLAGLLEGSATESAWNNAIRGRWLGPWSLFSLAVHGLPLALVLGLPMGLYYHQALSQQIADVGWAVETARDPGSNLRALGLNFLEPYRERMRSAYTVERVKGATSLAASSALDVMFDDGFILRCQHAGEFLAHCTPLDDDLRAWDTDLLTVGHLTCAGCPVRVERDTRRWLVSRLSGASPPRDVTLLRHMGGWIYLRATVADGTAIDCRFTGDTLIVVDLCLPAR
jgi:hypothetical protein